MISKTNHIDHFLKRIQESNTFSKSPVNRELLKYLVKASVSGDNPREYQIAAAVFGRKIGESKEVNVRVYIQNLRKKLQEYYAKEGKEEELVFVLPKGDYKVHFRYSRLRRLKKLCYARAPLVLLLSILILFVSGILMYNNPAPDTNIDFWKPFLKGDHPVFIVLGDHYFFRSRIATGQMVTVRDNQINSDTDFQRFLAENPEKIPEMRKSELTYINNQAPIGLFHIMNILGGGTEIKMDYASRVRMDDFRGHHVIFIGSFKTLHILVPAIEKLGLKYDIENSLLEYCTKDSVLKFDNYSDDYLSYEYAALICFMNRDGRRIVFFLCDNDIGNIALVKYMTGAETGRSFEKALHRLEPGNYKGIFEVKGQQRTDFEISLVRLDPLPGNAAEIWP
ncbi:MAG: hypothetical protein AB7D05_03365 [Mangrovibacterium sp.]